MKSYIFNSLSTEPFILQNLVVREKFSMKIIWIYETQSCVTFINYLFE